MKETAVIETASTRKGFNQYGKAGSLFSFGGRCESGAFFVFDLQKIIKKKKIEKLLATDPHLRNVPLRLLLCKYSTGFI